MSELLAALSPNLSPRGRLRRGVEHSRRGDHPRSLPRPRGVPPHRPARPRPAGITSSVGHPVHALNAPLETVTPRVAGTTAGSTRPRRWTDAQPWDRPRVRGEDPIAAKVDSDRGRITPACAGTTLLNWNDSRPKLAVESVRSQRPKRLWRPFSSESRALALHAPERSPVTRRRACTYGDALHRCLRARGSRQREALSAE